MNVRASHVPAAAPPSRLFGMDEPMHPVQIVAIRRMSLDKRFATGMGLIRGARALHEAGVRTRHPEWTADQVRAESQRLIANARS
jgi:hypothetical protein